MELKKEGSEKESQTLPICWHHQSQRHRLSVGITMEISYPSKGANFWLLDSTSLRGILITDNLWCQKRITTVA